tara:strand:+ start:345 stop:602 length:258 start_codon:yes stop_codon:yes gene_type:complete
MAKVVSVSVPDELHDRWASSGLDISPSQIFQTALEQQLGRKGQLFAYWSTRALSAEKKLKTIMKIISAPETEIKRFLMFDDLSSE